MTKEIRSKSEVVVSIDPGVSTGCVVVRCGVVARTEVYLKLTDIARLIREECPGTVVMEDFVGSRRWVQYRRPIEVIGAVRLVCEELGIPVILQSPSILQSLRLQALARDLPSPHTRSALIHALHFLHV